MKTTTRVGVPGKSKLVKSWAWTFDVVFLQMMNRFANDLLLIQMMATIKTCHGKHRRKMSRLTQGGLFSVAFYKINTETFPPCSTAVRNEGQYLFTSFEEVYVCEGNKNEKHAEQPTWRLREQPSSSRALCQKTPQRGGGALHIRPIHVGRLLIARLTTACQTPPPREEQRRSI